MPRSTATISGRRVAAAGFLLAALLAADSPSPPGLDKAGVAITTPAPPDFESTLGVKVVSVQTSMARMMLDFRFRVLDAEKAKPLFSRQSKPHAVHLESGTKLPVATGKLGQLRSLTTPLPGHTYYMLFVNHGGIVKTGDKVTIVLDGFKAENLAVE